MARRVARRWAGGPTGESHNSNLRYSHACARHFLQPRVRLVCTTNALTHTESRTRHRPPQVPPAPLPPRQPPPRCPPPPSPPPLPPLPPCPPPPSPPPSPPPPSPPPPSPPPPVPPPPSP